jgi:hypothetical protein
VDRRRSCQDGARRLDQITDLYHGSVRYL